MNTNSRNLTLLTDLYELTMMQGYFKTHSKEHVSLMFFIARIRAAVPMPLPAVLTKLLITSKTCILNRKILII